jgi:hypothetical protein
MRWGYVYVFDLQSLGQIPPRLQRFMEDLRNHRVVFSLNEEKAVFRSSLPSTRPFRIPAQTIAKIRI